MRDEQRRHNGGRDIEGRTQRSWNDLRMLALIEGEDEISRTPDIEQPTAGMAQDRCLASARIAIMGSGHR